MTERDRQPELVVGALLVDPRDAVFTARFAKIPGRYAVPGGHIEYGERAADALIRELREETNLTPTEYRLLLVHERLSPPRYGDGRHHLVYLDFLVEAWDGMLRLDGQELSDGVWLPPEEMLALPLTHTTRRLVDYYARVGRRGPADYQPDDR